MGDAAQTLRLLDLLSTASVYVTVAGWVLTLVEQLAVLMLAGWAFRIGSTTQKHSSRRQCPPGLLATSRGQTTHTVYRVLDGQRCVFRQKWLAFGIFTWYTPLERKGVISWEDGVLTTAGRHSLGTMLFFVGWLGAWTSIGMRGVVEGDMGGFEWVAVGWASVAAMALISRWIERERFDWCAGEVRVALRQDPRLERTAAPE